MQNPSLGREALLAQGTPDRHHATVPMHRQSLRIGTWNVRTMYQCGKLHNVILEMQRLNLDTLGCSEVRWTKSGKIKINDTTFVYSGDEKLHVGGTGILLSHQASSAMLGYWAVSDRVIMVKLHAKPFNINIIQVYAPTSTSSEEALEDFYANVDKAMKECKSQEIKIVMGDLNAIVGEGRYQDIVGPHGLGLRNERGEAWIEWCEQKGQVITNTWFQHHPRRRWTWKSPDQNTRNQIDFITINRRFRNSVTQAKGYPGADCNSDHIVVVCSIRTKLKKLTNKKSSRRFDFFQLRNSGIARHFREAVETELKEEQQMDDIDKFFNSFQRALSNATDKSVPYVIPCKKQEWMTTDILDLMEMRRKAKGDNDRYRELHRYIRNRCRIEKEKYYVKQCEELERLEKKNPQLMHNKIRQVTGRRKCAYRSSCIEDKEGNIIMENQEILHRWEEYIRELFKDNRGQKPDRVKTGGNLILEEEVSHALRCMSTGKTAGPDGLTAEMFTALGEFGVKQITHLANRIYEEGHFPMEMVKSVFIVIPKKPGATKCEQFRTISLMSHLTKLILRVLLNRIRGRTKGEISEEQYGFRPDKGTRNALFIMRMLSERAIQMQKVLYVCFIDYVKAFDKVQHQALMKVLDMLDIDGKEIELIKNLYWNQLAAVKIDGKMSNWLNIERGVRQGCILSPDLFSLYTEVIMQSVQEMDGFKIGGVNITNVRYADDTVVISDSEEKLQNLMNVVVAESEKKGLLINRKKSFCLVFSKTLPVPQCNVQVNGEMLEQVAEFTYLGSTVTSDGRCEKEIKRRIGIAKSTFKKMERVLTTKTINLSTRLRLMRCYVWSMLLYGSECWTINKAMQQRLEAVEMWFLRRMMRISWTDHVTNIDVLERARLSRTLLKTIVTRQLRFLGHILRKNSLESLALTGAVEGRRARGRQRWTYLTWLNDATGIRPLDIIRRCQQRDHSFLISNVRF